MHKKMKRVKKIGDGTEKEKDKKILSNIKSAWLIEENKTLKKPLLSIIYTS